MHAHSNKNNEEVKSFAQYSSLVIVTVTVKRRGPSKNWIVLATLYNIAPLSALDISLDFLSDSIKNYSSDLKHEWL